MSGSDRGGTRKRAKAKERAVIKIDAPSRLIQPADSVPRARPAWLRPDHNNANALKSSRRSTAAMLTAKGIAKRFWPPMGKNGEPVSRKIDTYGGGRW